MPSSRPENLTPIAVYHLLRDHAWIWIAPAVAGLVLTAAATLVTPRKWKATQGMIIRSEAAGYADQRLGKFTDLSEMRTAQETVLELARSRSVLKAALEQVGPRPSMFAASSWPSAQDIEDLRENLRVSPPGGAEFGATEVFYVTVFDQDAERAVELVDALAHHLNAGMQQLRNQQATGLVEEVEQAAVTARTELRVHTDRLATMEAAIGADLDDLRSLMSSQGGRGSLAQQALAIEGEIRGAELEQERNRQLLDVLKVAAENTNQLLATPATLLASQPALERLKTGLIDAQMHAASLQGTRAAAHPLVVAAKEAERLRRQELRKEVPAAVAGVELELALSQRKTAALQHELAQVRGRLSTLAGARAEYSRLVAAVENQTELVNVAEAQLADARAHNAGAAEASVLGRVDGVEAGIRPVGPGRATVALAGGLGGLILGVGLVFALHGPRPAGAAGIPDDAGAPRPASWLDSFPPQSAATATPVAVWTEYSTQTNTQPADSSVCAV